MIGQRVTGRRHHHDCRCGCQFVEGIQGEIVEARADLDVFVASFWVPYDLTGGRQLQRVAYTGQEVKDAQGR